MASTVDELTIAYEEDGQELVKELDKVVLSKGAWTTILFKYQDWDRSKNCLGQEKFSIRRYRKIKGNYVPQTKFNISSKDQARKIIDALERWLEE